MPCGVGAERHDPLAKDRFLCNTTTKGHCAVNWVATHGSRKVQHGNHGTKCTSLSRIIPPLSVKKVNLGLDVLSRVSSRRPLNEVARLNSEGVQTHTLTLHFHLTGSCFLDTSCEVLGALNAVLLLRTLSAILLFVQKRSLLLGDGKRRRLCMVNLRPSSVALVNLGGVKFTIQVRKELTKVHLGLVYGTVNLNMCLCSLNVLFEIDKCELIKNPTEPMRLGARHPFGGK